MIKKIFLAFIFSAFLIVPKSVLAAEEFASSYDIVYDVDESGITTITEKISLRNLTSEYYADKFKLTIGATQISDIKASDQGGAIETTSELKNNTTSINFKFNQQVAGLGKTLSWTLQFKSKDFAEKVGKVWEVRIPKIASSTNPESYNLTLAVPQSFGEPSLIAPPPKSQTISSGKMFLTFDKDQLKNSGISANFGTTQLFDFDLSYHLENKNLMPVLTNIALPPDTAFQDVIYQRINPKPLNVTLDSDGNYLAWYKLSRGQKLDIKAIGSAKLYASSKVKNPNLDNTLRIKYTSSDKYWEKDNPQIANKLSEILLSDQSSDNSTKAKLIYQFVVNFLKYDSERLKNSNIERLGAVTALNYPDSAVCMEFSDLFIALARAAGIPARELAGYGHTTNIILRPLSLTQDILHAWPEYWDDKKGWIMVDPTWENTTGGVDYFNKLDLNHFTFAINGISSTQPVPVGSYKYSGQDSHDVKVSLSEIDFLGKPQINVEINTSNPIIAGFPGKVKVKIQNLGNAVYPTNNLNISAGNLSFINNSGKSSGAIPAYGMAEFEFDTRTKSLFDKYSDQIVVTVGKEKFTKDVSVAPFILFRRISLIAFGILASMVLIYITVLGGHIYRFKFKKKKKK